MQGLLGYLDFIDDFLIMKRSPRETYSINFQILKEVLSADNEFTTDNFPGGCGPDGRYYDKIIPNSEPWFTSKLICGDSLQSPDPMNQGEFLCRLLNLTESEVSSVSPLFGERKDVQNYICIGLCRQKRVDRKQPSRTKIDSIWEIILRWNIEVFALDYQDWYQIPSNDRVRDWRTKPWTQKVPILNRSRLFIGIDGGLNHFAAACGCPTFSFYGENNGCDFGKIVGPYPQRTPFGNHAYFNRFDEFLKGIHIELGGLSISH
jgi:hypothetical protein